LDEVENGFQMKKSTQQEIKEKKIIPSKQSSFLPFFRKLLSKIDWNCVKSVLAAFLITRFVIFVITYFSLALIPPSTSMSWFVRLNPGNLLLDGLIRWDGINYLTIAKDGYTNPSLYLYLPLYPLLIRGTFFLIKNFYFSALLIPNLSFLISLFYLYLFTKEEFGEGTAFRTVFYIACAPTAFFFSAAYTEGVALLFVAACFYYSIKEKWFLAGLAGALASATKIQCVFLSVFILFEYFWRNNIRFIPKPWNLKGQLALLKKDFHEIPRMLNGFLASFLSLTGFLAHIIYLYSVSGDILMFFHSQQNWERTFALDWPIKLVSVVIDLHKITGNILAGKIDNLWQIIDTLSVFIFIPLVIFVLLKFRPSLSLYTLFSFCLPLTTLRTISMQRYVLMLIPCFILLAIWGKRVWVDRLIIGIFLPLQAFFLILYSHWYWAG
jgi:hypothetical protein